MKIKCFSKNKNEKIEFTESELEKLLDEVYTDGYTDGQTLSNTDNIWWWYPHSYPNHWYTTAASTHDATVKYINTTSSSDASVECSI